jgi:ribonuclease PH
MPVARPSSETDAQTQQHVNTVESLVTRAVDACVLVRHMPRTQLMISIQLLHNDGRAVVCAVNAAA